MTVSRAVWESFADDKSFVRFHLSPQTLPTSRLSHLSGICVVDSNTAAGDESEKKVTQCEFLMRHSKIFTSARNGTKTAFQEIICRVFFSSPATDGSLMLTGSPLAFRKSLLMESTAKANNHGRPQVKNDLAN
jgi:hypothetical protein